MTPNPTEIRRTILRMLYKSGAGHLGCCMSVVEMLIAMYGSVDVEKIKQGAPDRDRLVISKGHCAAAVYAALAAFEILEAENLQSYHADGSVLAGLVSHAAKGVELSTGSLGHGINVAAGCALGLRRRNCDAKVLCLLGDGEMQEGSVWEALMFAAHHRLDNLTILIDDNHIGSVTRTERVMRLRLEPMLIGFGWDVLACDGHWMESISAQIAHPKERPTAIMCRTIKGFGVPLAEDEPRWHYASLDADTYAQALETLHS